MWVTGIANCSFATKARQGIPFFAVLKRVAVIGTSSADTLTPRCLATS
jgi:hypothetical protein